MKTKKIQVELQPIMVSTIKVEITGKTPLLMDRFPDSAKQGILAKQTGVSKGNKRKTRDTKQEIKDAIHYINPRQVGFPSEGFKRGMIECTSFVGDKMFSKKLVSGAVKILNGVNGLIPLKFRKQDVLEHAIGHNVKFSPQFHGWSCELEIEFDTNNISGQDIVTLLRYAGFYNGIGAWRPKCKDGGSGEFGLYDVKIKKRK